MVAVPSVAPVGLVHADAGAVLEALPPRCIQLAVLDPPYYRMVDEPWDRQWESEEDYVQWVGGWIDPLCAALRTDGSTYLFGTPRMAAKLGTMLLEPRLEHRSTITWVKRDGFSAPRTTYARSQEQILYYAASAAAPFHRDAIREPYRSTKRIRAATRTGIPKDGRRWFPNPKGRLATDVWEFTSQRHLEKVHGRTVRPPHATIKPTALIGRIVAASSDVGGLVLDPFAGSGTTAVVAAPMSRPTVLCEKEERYLPLIRQRLAALPKPPEVLEVGPRRSELRSLIGELLEAGGDDGHTPPLPGATEAG